MRKKSIAITSLVVLLTGIGQARSPITLDALRRDGYGVVTIKHPRPNELVVHATINDRPVELIIDTGWGGKGIALNQDLARALKLKAKPLPDGYTWTGAKIGNAVAMGGRVLLGNALITDVPLFFGNLEGLRMYDNLAAIGSLVPVQRGGAGGIVTNGFLHATSAIIDLINLQLYLRPPAIGHRAIIGPVLKEIGLAEVPLTITADYHFIVDAEVNGETGKMLIDTGGYLTILQRQFAARAKTGWNSTKIQLFDAAGKKSMTNLVNVRSFKIAGVPVDRPDATIASATFGPGVVGTIGMDVLGQNKMIIDCGEKKLYFAARQR